MVIRAGELLEACWRITDYLAIEHLPTYQWPNTPLSRRGRGEIISARGRDAAPVGCSDWFGDAPTGHPTGSDHPFSRGGPSRTSLRTP